MKFWATPPQHRARGRLAGVVMLTLWLGMFAVAVFPPLHRWLHGDAQGPGHQCVVTQVQQHLLPGASGPVAVPAAPGRVVPQPHGAETEMPGQADYRVSLSRAPPSFFSSSDVVG